MSKRTPLVQALHEMPIPGRMLVPQWLYNTPKALHSASSRVGKATGTHFTVKAVLGLFWVIRTHAKKDAKNT